MKLSKKAQRVKDWLPEALEAHRAGDVLPPPPKGVTKKEAQRAVQGSIELMERFIAEMEEKERAIQAEILGAWDDFDRPRGLALD